jgi:ATPase subunit of ABC transporter with duplicated ATPase domains
MSTLLTAHSLSKSYVSNALFDGITLRLVEDDRLGIIGPNGAGKSTLLKILAGLDSADAGEVTRRRGLRMVYVPQGDHFCGSGSGDTTRRRRCSSRQPRPPSVFWARIIPTRWPR